GLPRAAFQFLEGFLSAQRRSGPLGLDEVLKVAPVQALPAPGVTVGQTGDGLLQAIVVQAFELPPERRATGDEPTQVSFEHFASPGVRRTPGGARPAPAVAQPVETGSACAEGRRAACRGGAGSSSVNVDIPAEVVAQRAGRTVADRGVDVRGRRQTSRELCPRSGSG